MSIDILDKSIDDIEDLPGFEVPPNGVYILRTTAEVKQVNNKDAVEFKFSVVECVEQNNSEDTPAIPGTQFSTLYFLDNEIAVGRMKEMLVPFAAHFQNRNLRTLVTEHIKDVLVSAKVKQRKDKKEPDRVYADVSQVTVE